MGKMKFHILDVFAREKYQGNQLAVMIADEILGSVEMQRIAREINFSETSFICRIDHDKYCADVRIFSPMTELDFAGHPVIGTAFILKKIFNHSPEDILLNLKAGPVKVRFSNDSSAPVWIKQPDPVFGDNLDIETVAELLYLPDIAFVKDLPFQMVSTGLPHFIIPVRSLDWLKKSRINQARYWKLAEATKVKNFLIYTEEPYEENQDIAVRMFAHALGIPEDPATGSGNGCLAAYLLHNRYKDLNYYKFNVGQGYEIGRPSHLHLEVKRLGNKYEILLGGNAVEVASGIWRI